MTPDDKRDYVAVSCRECFTDFDNKFHDAPDSRDYSEIIIDAVSHGWADEAWGQTCPRCLRKRFTQKGDQL